VLAVIVLLAGFYVVVETAFSVLKRKFWESLKARNYRSRIKEPKIKLILYNISKHLFMQS
jgi:hypothetical protein